jgi:hypothetical protein
VLEQIDVGQQSAIESISEIEKMLDRNTKWYLSLPEQELELHQ